MAGGGGGGGPAFESTPSWVMGAVVLVMVAISLAIEKFLHFLGQKLKDKEKKPLYESLQKIKEELMLLGFVSLLLAVLQDEIANICVSEKLAMKWIPCVDEITPETTTHFQISRFFNGRRRLLAEEDGESSCPEGKAHIVSIAVLHELHYLIFVLAIVHVVTCTVTLVLGEMKISQWRKWEESIRKRKIVQPNAEEIH